MSTKERILNLLLGLITGFGAYSLWNRGQEAIVMGVIAYYIFITAKIIVYILNNPQV